MATDGLAALVREWVAGYRVERIVVGNRTAARDALSVLADLGLGPQIVTVDEQGSTLRARERYFADHPRRGWRRFVPVSLQEPPEAYDDYAAIVLAESYLAGIGQ